MNNLVKFSIMLLLIGSFAGLSWANKACQTPDGELNIMISPKTLILSSPCDTLTIHSNIPYQAVIATSVKVNGVEVPFTKSDDCGDLVAKIGVDDLAEFLQPGQTVTLTLSGVFVDGEVFAVNETITVKD